MTTPIPSRPEPPEKHATTPSQILDRAMLRAWAEAGYVGVKEYVEEVNHGTD